MWGGTWLGREARAAAAFSAGGCAGEGSRPAGVHGVEEHPGAAVAEAEAAGGLREGAAGGDLFEEVGAGFGEGGFGVEFDPDAAAETDGGGQWLASGGASASGGHA